METSIVPSENHPLKSNKSLFYILLFPLIFFPTALLAQIELGGTAGYGGLQSVGVSIRGEIRIGDPIIIQSDIGVFSPSYYGSFLDLGWWDFNANAHYMVYEMQGADLTFLAGINGTDFLETGEYDRMGVVLSNAFYMGVNLGGSVRVKVDGLKFIAEGKYILGEFSRPEIMVGMQFPLK